LIRPRIIIALLFVFNYWCAYAQVPQFSTTNFTIENGLPSNECHDVVQDSLGYIWIATDRGLVQYDGYEFKTYGIQEGLENISCLKLFLDRKGTIWISTFSKRIFKYIPSVDSIVQYEFNYLLEPYYKEISRIVDLYLDVDETMHIVCGYQNIINISSEGHFNFINPPSSKKCGYTYEVEDQIFFCYYNPQHKDVNSKTSKLKYTKGKYFLPVYHQGLTYNMPILDELSHSQFSVVFNLDKSNVFLWNEGYGYFFMGDKEPKRKRMDPFMDIEIVDSINLFTAGIKGLGVNYYQSFEDLIDGNSKAILSNVSASRILRTDDGNIFVTTLDQGLYFLKQHDFENIDLNVFNDSRISSIESGINNDIYYVVNERELFMYSLSTKKSKSVFKSKSTLSDISFFKDENKLVVADIINSFYVDNNSKYQITYPTNSTLEYGLGKKSYLYNDGLYFLLTIHGFVVFKNLNELPIFDSRSLIPNKRLNAIVPLEDSIYLMAGTDGLFQFDFNSLDRVRFDYPIFNTRINDLKLYKEQIVIGSQGFGIAIWNKKDSLQIINTTDGLISNNVEQLFIDDKDRIYVCTKSGLSKVWFDSNDAMIIKNYSSHHGLGSNEINDVTQLGDTIFVATGQGITILKEELEVPQSHSVLIGEISVNGENRDQSNLHLKHFENNLSVNYKTLDYKMQGDITYRFQLNNGPWTETKSTFANFTTLPPDNYTFSVASKNIDDVWSSPSKLSFKISSAWWLSWWFKLGCASLFLVIAYRYYRSRINALEEKVEIEHELRELEKSALQAQMNPHFIFNALNSIQRFIMDNDKEKAMDYLSRFAKLIRKNLNASSNSVISLENEVSILDNYLALEKLRCNNSFEYDIQVAKSIDPKTTILPPMLIQPFVENAVVHGMRNIKSNGLITVDFSKNQDQLFISIKDNGQGKQPNHDNGDHKSLGMSITNKRLAHINNSQNDNYKVTPQYSELGTEVQVAIRLGLV